MAAASAGCVRAAGTSCEAPVGLSDGEDLPPPSLIALHCIASPRRDCSYDDCASGYTDVVHVCWQNCVRGTDTGAFCSGACRDGDSHSGGLCYKPCDGSWTDSKYSVVSARLFAGGGWGSACGFILLVQCLPPSKMMRWLGTWFGWPLEAPRGDTGVSCVRWGSNRTAC